jgi:Raf kinase inhibitor-like YbhB/YbcL family protein
MLTLSIDAFSDGEFIPEQFTCEGDDVSPALAWSGEPAATRGFALIMDDPDAPAGTWDHWLLWDIPVSVHALPQHYRARDPVRSGANSFGKTGYGGPCPPKGHGPHRYFFRLYALDTAGLGVPDRSVRRELDRAIEQHQLASAEYMGRYERK